MSAINYHKRDFWGTENLKYATPHFRMRKVARVIRSAAARRAAGGPGLDLLDVGCGPGTLAALLPPGVRYHGIDIALAEPAPHLRESDIVTTPIDFGGRTFDIIVAQGLFEYMGTVHQRKLAEIAAMLAEGGTFICTYQNFAHRRRSFYWPYSNVIAPAEFRADVARHFRIERAFPTAYNWNQSHPNRAWLRVPQERLSVNVPLAGPMFAVDYCYVCSPLAASR
ncbi:MAG TPA: class I SAM-dependent methyltransferase [Trebonia sp.]|jgi:SAM-dependent methyltransferase|nr:class I SAM-dependent methyltransferase [Trebonia sp.]